MTLQYKMDVKVGYNSSQCLFIKQSSSLNRHDTHFQGERLRVLVLSVPMLSWKLSVPEIVDVAVTKRHQRLDEILTYFNPHFIEELSKVVFKKTVSCNTPTKLDTIMFAKHTLVINAQEMRELYTACACYKCPRIWQNFLVNSFADFLYCVGKKINSSSSRWWRFVTTTSAIPLDKKPTANCLAQTRTEQEELILAAMLKCGLTSSPCGCISPCLIVFHKMVCLEPQWSANICKVHGGRVELQKSGRHSALKITCIFLIDIIFLDMHTWESLIRILLLFLLLPSFSLLCWHI